MLRTALVALALLPILVAAPPAKKRPKLVVVISVDQLSAELMQTYGPELRGGLARLRREGVFFTEAYHDHGFTETGPGHSVLLSGRFPAHTGFLGEALGDWLQAQVPGSRVFAVSGKDRAAILMAGRRPTAVYWFTGAAGFTSSTAYGERLPDWLLRYDRDLAERLATDSWLWTKDPGTPEGRVGSWTFGTQILRNGALPRLIQETSCSTEY